MIDRLSKYPGRIKLKPVPGKSDVFDIEMADEASIQGTVIEKATMFDDDNAVAYGLAPNVATPNEAFKVVRNSFANTFNSTVSGSLISVDDVSPVEHMIQCKIRGVSNPSSVTVTRKRNDGTDVKTYTPAADGTISGMASLSPTMTILTDNPSAIIEVTYNQDSNKVMGNIDLSDYVQKTQKVNGKSLSRDITLTASDVKARPDTWTPTAEDVGALSKPGAGVTGDFLVRGADGQGVWQTFAKWDGGVF